MEEPLGIGSSAAGDCDFPGRGTGGNEGEEGLGVVAVGVVDLRGRNWAGNGTAASEVGEAIEDVSAVANAAAAAVVLIDKLDASVLPVVLSGFAAVVAAVPKSAAAFVDSISSAEVTVVRAMKVKIPGHSCYWC